MRYFKQYKGEDAVKEITKDEARQSLEGYWKAEALEDVFSNDKAFRLFTPYANIWTQTEDGAVPMAGFYGTVG